MSTRTTILGTACLLGMALVAGPAAAATLTGFAGTLNTEFANTDNNSPGSDAVKSWLLGGAVAGPLSDVAGMNFQVGASYTHNWAHQFSAENWNFGGDAFMAGMDSRVGADLSYNNFGGVGSDYNGGVLGEAYFGNVTGMIKGGWLWTTGSDIGGHGNYVGAALEFYAMPDLGITGGLDWGDIVTGRGCQICGRGDLNVTAWEIAAEFLFSEDYGVSGYAGFSYNQDKFFGGKTEDNVWRVGLRWYTGGGSLEDHHRNGNLNPWLPGANVFKP